MSYSILRVEKIKGNFITGIQIHNQREKDLSNKDIDKSRSVDNYDLHNNEAVNYNERFKEIIENNNITKMRKDAVKAVDILTTSDNNFFNNLSKKEREKYFKESYKFLCAKYGHENVIASVVHLDEKTPHMHTTIVPITSDHKLSAKELYNPKSLQILQTEYHQHLSKAGFEIQRGVTSDRKHIKLEEFKHKTKLQEQDNEFSRKQQSVSDKINNLNKKIEYKVQKLKDIAIEAEKIQSEIDKIKDVKEKKLEEIRLDIKSEEKSLRSRIPIYNSKKSDLSDFKRRFGFEPSLISKKLTIGPDKLETLINEFDKVVSSSDNHKKAAEYEEKCKNEAFEERDKAKKSLSSTELERDTLKQKNIKITQEKQELEKTISGFIETNNLEKSWKEYPVIEVCKRIKEKFNHVKEYTQEIKKLENESEYWGNSSLKWDELNKIKEYRKETYDKINDLIIFGREYENFKDVSKEMNLDTRINKHEKMQRHFKQKEMEIEKEGFDFY